MFATLRNRNFALLWLGGLISMAADWMLFIALPVYIYEETQSTLATGLMFMAGAAPSILLGSVAGVFVDRWERKRTMVISNALLTLTLLPLLLVSSFGWLWVIYLFRFVQSTIAQFINPAENAFLPKLVGEEHLVPANALNSLNNNLARFIGPAVGGLVVAVFGLQGVIIANVLCFSTATVLIGLINVTSQPVKQDEEDNVGNAWFKVWREWQSGMRFIRRDPVVSRLIGIMVIPALGEGVIATMFVVWVTVALSGGALELGWLMSAQAVGGIIGGAIIGWVGKGIAPAVLLGGGALGLGLIDLIIFNSPLVYPSLAPVIALFVVVGIPVAGLGAGMNTLFQTLVADEFRGRVFGAFGTSYSILAIAGMGLASWLGDIVGPYIMLNFQGGTYTLAGLLVLLFVRPLVSRVSAAKIPATEAKVAAAAETVQF